MNTLYLSGGDRSEDRRGGNRRKAKRRRGPVFGISREDVFIRCYKAGHGQLTTGLVLALRDLMELRGWSTQEVAEHCRVSRPMVSAILNVNRVATLDTVNELAKGFNVLNVELVALSERVFAAEVPRWWHSA
ncbi:MAG: helix-turn-helix transcriptional regulator [Verrucomicrobiaceae bacterium]|nr:helix-turn-helix transcriptional regulator [Verrucomicrobiaceae bacterium]